MEKVELASPSGMGSRKSVKRMTVTEVREVGKSQIRKDSAGSKTKKKTASFSGSEVVEVTSMGGATAKASGEALYEGVDVNKNRIRRIRAEVRGLRAPTDQILPAKLFDPVV